MLQDALYDYLKDKMLGRSLLEIFQQCSRLCQDQMAPWLESTCLSICISHLDVTESQEIVCEILLNKYLKKLSGEQFGELYPKLEELVVARVQQAVDKKCRGQLWTQAYHTPDFILTMAGKGTADCKFGASLLDQFAVSAFGFFNTNKATATDTLLQTNERQEPELLEAALQLTRLQKVWLEPVTQPWLMACYCRESTQPRSATALRLCK